MTKKEWLIAVVLTFITICFWVASDILHTRSKVDIPEKTKEAIEPIDPQFNLKVLEQIPDSQVLIEPTASSSASIP